MLGWSELKKSIVITAESVECPVIGCSRRVARQRCSFTRQREYQCPVHGIFISPSTFEYANEQDNMLWAAPDDIALWTAIKTPGIKRESRFARDNSEDAVTWNVFRYLEQHRLLGAFVDLVSGKPLAKSPRLIYWSYCQDTKRAWQPMLDAAARFGENVRRRSEPDLIIDDERVLIFVESKLTAGNRTMPTDPTNPKSYLSGCGNWYAQVFVPTSTFRVVAVQDRLYELMRLWLIGSWIAASKQKHFVLVNLVRGEAKREQNIEERFSHHVRVGSDRRFIRWTWERIRDEIVTRRAGDSNADRLLAFFQGTTLGYSIERKSGSEEGRLRKAFAV